MTEPSFDELLRRLVDARVRFVLVGGLAVNAWGVVRGTRDVDIAVDPDPDNLMVLAALVALAAGERVLIDTDLGPLDVVQGLEGVPPYDDLRARAVEVAIAGVSVSVCSLEDLRAMKRAAGRMRDLADLEDLDAAHPRQ